jgi:serine/threonine-protein kinase RsbW
MAQSPSESDCRTVDLAIPSDPRNLVVVRGALEKMAGQEGFSASDVDGIVLAVDEALANVMKHGYEGRRDCTIRVRLEMVTSEEGRRGLLVTVRDFGKQVDPSVIRGRNLEEVRPGGLGVHIIRSVMDRVEYACPTDGGMQLKMTKYLRSPGDRSD